MVKVTLSHAKREHAEEVAVATTSTADAATSMNSKHVYSHLRGGENDVKGHERIDLNRTKSTI